MNPSSRALIAQWVIVIALLLAMFAATRCGVLVYFTWQNAGISIYQPIPAEEVSRQAKPFQNNTAEVNGMFKIVQRQHSEMDLMFRRLEIEAQMVWGLALLGTVAFTTLSILLAACHILLRAKPKT